MAVSDKIDRVVTNRFLALPIFAVVMFVVYFVSVTTVGTWVTDWTRIRSRANPFAVENAPAVPMDALVTER